MRVQSIRSKAHPRNQSRTVPSHLLRFLIAVVALFCVGLDSASGLVVRGVGTAFLIGGDLTDPENDGDPENNVNYNATFAASEEPTFGGAEGAFNVFDNQVGGGNMKWCCGDLNNFPTNPISIDAIFAQPFVLGRFTITSGNDTPARDPLVWQILGSNDGTNFTPIFTRNDPSVSLWTLRNQVLQFDAGVDFATPAAYNTIRFLTTATGATTGARFQVNELEYFAIPEPSAAILLGFSATFTAFARRRRK